MIKKSFDVTMKIERMKYFITSVSAISIREILKFSRQKERFYSALVRPALWLFVFAVGSQNALGISIVEPYKTYTPYQEYILPGLIGLIILFQSMQSSLSLVYDREIGVMKALLMSPMSRSSLLFAKIIAAALISTLQIYIFLMLALIFDIYFTLVGWFLIFPVILLGGMTMGSIGLCVTLYAKKIENFAGMMNFVVFPMFFFSPALYPLWKFRELDANIIYYICIFNPFTYVIELIRFTAYSQTNFLALSITVAVSFVCFATAVRGYDNLGR